MTVLRDKVVKIRKSQNCWGCGERFEVGAKLRHQTDVDENGFCSSYWCKVCDVTAKNSYDEQVDCGIGFGVVKDYCGWDENLQIIERTY